MNTDFCSPGGSIEFLPVTVTSADVTFSAILQVAVHAGFNMDIPSALSSFGVSAGIEAYAFSNLAEFTMSITGEEETREENGCMLNIANDFKFGVGVGAGATAALTGQTWGPTAHSTVDIWTTTFWDVCGNRVPATISPVPTKTVQRRQVASTRKMSTATKKTTAAYTGVVCKEPLKECPASLQKHTVVSSIMTLTSVLPSGATPAWPTTAYESVVKTMDFGEGRRKLFVAAGEPTAKMANNFVDDTKDKLKGKGVDKKMIIGVSVGVGGFVILVAIGGIIFCIRRRRLQTQPPAGTGYLGLGAGSGNENSSTPGVSTESINVPRKGI